MKERELIQSILCKFIINLPQEELKDSGRLSQHAKKAFYYLIDEVQKQKEVKDWDKQINQFLLKLKQYSSHIIKINPQEIVAKLQENKPVCGAIIFNKENTKVLVVRTKNNKLGFPKGKWNQHQTEEACAAREVQQQTGLYIHQKIDPKIRIQFEHHGCNSYFFVARGVGEDERIKIDPKQIEGTTWMWAQDIRSNFARFVQKSRIAWSYYQQLPVEKSEPIQRPMSVEEFIQKYTQQDKQNKQQVNENMANPFLNFKLNRQRLKFSEQI